MPRPLERLIRKSSVSLASWLCMIAIVLAGCDSPAPTGLPDPDADAGPAPCAPGKLTLDDGTCQKAGLPPDMLCPPGELPLDNGTCQKAGVPASACGAGFVPDGKDGCEPILPAEPCPEGLMAIPGDTVCREVAPCGSGTWGDIPVEANTQFVDKSYAGGNSDGTQAKPWTSIQQGLAAAAKGAIVAVAAGSYPEDVVIHGQTARLWGRCPAMVEIVGTGAKIATIQVLQKAASGAEIHGVAVSGPKVGIGVSGASDVVIEGAWIHGTGNDGLNVQDDLGLTSVALKGSLVEQNDRLGIHVGGSDATIEATVVRGALPDAQGQLGRGINVQAGSNVTVRACLVEQNHNSGIYVGGADATVENTVVRGTLRDEQGKNGVGIGIENDPDAMERANVTVRACLVEKNHSAGIFVVGSDATIEATVVRATLPEALGMGGAGISAQEHPITKERASVTINACLIEQNEDEGVSVFNSSAVVRACVIEQNRALGVFVSGAEATIESTVVRSTLPNEKGEHGRGINIQGDLDSKERSTATVRACLVEENHEIGVFVGGSDATIEASEIRSTLPDVAGDGGRGISIGNTLVPNARANVTVRACLVEQNREVAIFVQASDATIEATVARGTLPGALGTGGRGINIQDDTNIGERGSAVVRACLVEQNHDIGVTVAASDATIETTAVLDTMPNSDGTFGDGITVDHGKATIQRVEITSNSRAGVASFSSEVLITDSVITCNGIDLNGESVNDIPFSFDGSAGWQCSDKEPAACTVLDTCQVRSEDMAAPSTLPPTAPVQPAAPQP